MAERPAGRRGGRAARRAVRTARPEGFMGAVERRLPPVEATGEAGLDRIHEASLRVLEETGIEFRDPIAIEDWRRAGAEVEGTRVRLDRGLVMELVASVPETFTLHARNPARSVRIGGEASVFVPCAGPPYVRDLEGRRRPGTLADLNDLHRLAHLLPALHSSGHVVCEPMDVPVAHRHLHITLSSVLHSDKTFMGMSTGGANAEDVMAMVDLVFGADFVERNAVVVGNINANSPLVWDETMLGALRAFTRRNQPVLCSPFVLGGANTPASTVPAVVQLNAEALAGLAYTQVVRRGAPAIYGHYLSTVSMRSGAPMAGTPEISLMNFLVGQLARRYRVPWRTSSALGGAKVFDAQSGYESATTLTAAVLAGANFIWHSAGWDEAGLACCLAKFVVDAEQCAMAARMAEGPRWDDFDEAVAEIARVGPGGHFLGTDHTQANFERAFFIPRLLDNDGYEQWEAAGAKATPERAREAARALLAAYERPAIDSGVEEALREYVARREREIPDAFA